MDTKSTLLVKITRSQVRPAEKKPKRHRDKTLKEGQKMLGNHSHHRSELNDLSESDRVKMYRFMLKNSIEP